MSALGGWEGRGRHSGGLEDLIRDSFHHVIRFSRPESTDARRRFSEWFSLSLSLSLAAGSPGHRVP
eukprot:scaffold253501_cov31-Tisochrysis_lutea.AAC.1